MIRLDFESIGKNHKIGEKVLKKVIFFICQYLVEIVNKINYKKKFDKKKVIFEKWAIAQDVQGLRELTEWKDYNKIRQ